MITCRHTPQERCGIYFLAIHNFIIVFSGSEGVDIQLILQVLDFTFDLIEESADVPFEMVHVFAFHLYTACTTGFLTKDMLFPARFVLRKKTDVANGVVIEQRT
jgi:hypothetical protein